MLGAEGQFVGLVMVGLPIEIVGQAFTTKVTVIVRDVQPCLLVLTEIVHVPVALGVPVSSPVLELNDNPKPVKVAKVGELSVKVIGAVPPEELKSISNVGLPITVVKVKFGELPVRVTPEPLGATAVMLEGQPVVANTSDVVPINISMNRIQQLKKSNGNFVLNIKLLELLKYNNIGI